MHPIHTLIEHFFNKNQTLTITGDVDKTTKTIDRETMFQMLSELVLLSKNTKLPTVIEPKSSPNFISREQFFINFKEIAGMSVKEDIQLSDTLEELGINDKQLNELKKYCLGIEIAPDYKISDILVDLRIKQIQQISNLKPPEEMFLKVLMNVSLQNSGFQTYQLQQSIANDLSNKGLVQLKTHKHSYDVKVEDSFQI